MQRWESNSKEELTSKKEKGPRAEILKGLDKRKVQINNNTTSIPKFCPKSPHTKPENGDNSTVRKLFPRAGLLKQSLSYLDNLQSWRGENIRIWSYLLKTGLDKVFREEISNKVQEGIQAGHFIILLPRPQLLLEFGVPWVDSQDQDDPQHGGNDGRGHVIHHGPGA